MNTNEAHFQFKTNINCGGCIANVKPFLDQAEGIGHWEIDTKDPNKILRVSSTGITREGIMEIVKKAGFRIE